jgi:hypothetical protein
MTPPLASSVDPSHDRPHCRQDAGGITACSRSVDPAIAGDTAGNARQRSPTPRGGSHQPQSLEACTPLTASTETRAVVFMASKTTPHLRRVGRAGRKGKPIFDFSKHAGTISETCVRGPHHHSTCIRIRLLERNQSPDLLRGAVRTAND